MNVGTHRVLEGSFRLRLQGELLREIFIMKKVTVMFLEKQPYMDITYKVDLSGL